MKKINFIFILAATVFTLSARAHEIDNTYNPMFANGKSDSIGIYAAQSTNSGTLFKIVDPTHWQFSPQTFGMMQYSQKTTFFRLPARQNFNIIGNLGRSSSSDLSFWGVGFSIDASLFDWHGFYVGLGCGPYMRDQIDRWVDSRLVFGEKFFIGKNVSDRWRAELFTIHFSNGNFTEENEGFNFAGIAATYSF